MSRLLYQLSYAAVYRFFNTTGATIPVKSNTVKCLPTGYQLYFSVTSTGRNGPNHPPSSGSEDPNHTQGGRVFSLSMQSHRNGHLVLAE